MSKKAKRARRAAAAAAAAAPTTQQANPWAFQKPMNITDLLRQLSANVGQEFMPYGMGGDVRTPAFGMAGQPQQNVDPRTYGETGGETNFFTTSTQGGMAPISAAPKGVTNWDPLKLVNSIFPTQ